MSDPKISVIIPNYNHARYLKQRIDSVIDQTFQDFEIILLDDCSTDASREVLTSYRDHPRVRSIIFNEHNSGSPFKQWQKGIGLAKGEWIWIAESDDYADNRFLERLLPATRGSNIGLVYCDSKVVVDEAVREETFASIKNKRFKTDRWSRDHVNSGTDEIENYLLIESTINNTSAVLFNKQVLQMANPFDETFRYIGDKFTFVKVLSLADIAYVGESLNYYRDPFNQKHVDKYIFYFYEQFLVFDWVLRNMKVRDMDKFLDGFYSSTRSSLFRGWSMMKLSLYARLFKKNKTLLLKSIVRNLRMGIQGQFK